FIIDGEETVIEFEHGKVPYSNHGKPESFLDLAKHFHVPLEHACGGSCACTTCHVIIKEGEQHLSEMQDDEADRLDTAWGLTARSRLGRHAVITGDARRRGAAGPSSAATSSASCRCTRGTTCRKAAAFSSASRTGRPRRRRCCR